MPIQAALTLPLLIPLATAVVCLFGWRYPAVQRVISFAGSLALLLAAIVLFVITRRDGIVVVQMGNWPAPFGITLVSDLFSAIMVLVSAIIGFAVVIYSLGSIDRRRESFGYHIFFHLLLLGVCGAFLTGDLFNLYVWFEVMLISSFVLLALGGERAQLEGAIKYVTLNLFSSAVFLGGVGLVYGLAGTLNMADLALKLRAQPEQGLVLAAAMFFLVAFGIKAAVFPLFMWLPASYHTPPVAVSAVFSGLLTKVGVYAMIRVFTLLFGHSTGAHTIILVIAALTMLVGVLGAVAQSEFRRVLSFHIVSQIGYMILGLGFFTPLALAGSVFYIVHHIIVKTNLFLVSGVVAERDGNYALKDLGGVYRRQPWIAFLFLIPAMSLAGLPPLSGFFAKLLLIQAGLAIREYVVVAVALFVSLLTLFSMSKIWGEAFWKEKTEPPALAADAGDPARAGRSARDDRGVRALLMRTPIAALAAITILIGLAAEPLLRVSQDAAAQLLEPAQYIRAVLGAGR